MIDGVVIKKIETHTDERGFFREIFRVDETIFDDGDFAQWSHTRMYPTTAKAWHWHKKQIDWWYVVQGALKVALYDGRKNSPTFDETMEFIMGDDQQIIVVRIPEGVRHGCKALVRTDMIYMTSQTYDPNDEGREPHDDPIIGYDWTSSPSIK